MPNIAEVKQLLENFDKSRNPYKIITNEMIDATIAICLEWLTLTEGGVQDDNSNTLVQDWENYRKIYAEYNIPKNLSEVLMFRLLRGIYRDRSMKIVKKLSAEDDTIVKIDRIQEHVIFNAQIENHPQRFAFYKIFVRCDVFSTHGCFDELSCLFSKLTADEILPMIESIHNYDLKGIFSGKSLLVTNFVNDIIQRHPDLKENDLMLALVKQSPDSRAIQSAYGQLILSQINDETLRDCARRTFEVIDKASSLYDIQPATIALQLTNQLLTSAPASRAELLVEYQAEALKMQGSPSRSGQAIALVMLALGAYLIASELLLFFQVELQ